MSRKRIKELEKIIEEIEEFISYADSAYLDLREYQEEYKKLTGKEYEY